MLFVSEIPLLDLFHFSEKAEFKFWLKFNLKQAKKSFIDIGASVFPWKLRKHVRENYCQTDWKWGKACFGSLVYDTWRYANRSLIQVMGSLNSTNCIIYKGGYELSEET